MNSRVTAAYASGNSQFPLVFPRLHLHRLCPQSNSSLIYDFFLNTRCEVELMNSSANRTAGVIDLGCSQKRIVVTLSNVARAHTVHSYARHKSQLV